VLVAGSTFIGGISNAGTISSTNAAGILVGGVVPTGVTLNIATFGGGIANSGTISAGNPIQVGGNAFGTGAAVTISNFSGGISNSGSIGLAGGGIVIHLGGQAVSGGTVTVSTFAGGITNAGTLFSGEPFGGGILVGGSAFRSGVVDVVTVGGAIVNSGVITAGGGIVFGGLAKTGGSITIGNVSSSVSNSGTIIVNSGSAASGIAVGGTATGAGSSVVVSTFSGGITNSGTISGTGAPGNAIFVGGRVTNGGSINVGSFGNGIFNATTGLLAAAGNGIVVGSVVYNTSAFPTSVTVSNFSGGISNAGTIVAGGNAGIVVGGQVSAHVGSITISTFAGGITNSGTISATAASGNGILVGGHVATGSLTVLNFDSTGSIVNSGTIAAGLMGIAVGGTAVFGGAVTVSDFAGGISNAGTISAGVNGIMVGGKATTALSSVTISTFAGGITNAGKITAQTGVVVGGIAASGGSVTIGNFGGGITNSAGGTITAASFNGIDVGGRAVSGGTLTVSTFAGGITNSGTISAFVAGIIVGGSASGARSTVKVLNFSGGITNFGTITGDRPILASGGIVVGGAAVSGASVTVANFSGTSGAGISNAGLIVSNFRYGILVGGTAEGINASVTISTFTGGISNSGIITAPKAGILVGGSAFSANSTVNIGLFGGGIANSGTITAKTGIAVGGFATNSASVTISNFSGGISNNGRIVATGAGAIGILVAGRTFVGGPVTISTFSGGVSNSGTIQATGVGGVGIDVVQVLTFQNGITNSGLITVGANGAGIVVGATNFGGNVSNSGTITGGKTGIFVCECATFTGGSIFNTGIISGSTSAIDTSIATSAVTIAQNAGTMTGQIKLSAKADVLNINGGTIVGKGTLDTVNFSLTTPGTYTDTNTFSGATVADIINQVNVDSGTTLVLNSAGNTATGMTVSTGGTLSGTGTISTALNVFGTFAPGTTSTKMQITGSLTLQSASIYMVTINGLTTSGANVTVGTTIDTGAVAKANASSTPIVGTKYTILTASAGVSGTFADSTFFFGRYEGILSYDLDDVYLTVQNGALTPPPGAPQNVVNVANAINSALTGGSTLPPNFQNLFNYTPAQLQTALNQLSGQGNTGAGTSTFQLMNDFFNLLSDMTFGNGGGGAGVGGTAAGFAPEEHDGLPADVAQAYDQALGKAPAPPNFAQRWNAWGSAYGGSANYNGNAAIGSNNVNASDYGFAGGLDYYAAPDLKLGFALAGAGTNWHLSQNLGSGRSDVFQAAGYAIKHFGPAYISGMAAFGNSWFTTNRTAALGDQLRAKFEGQSYGLRAETGYRFAVLPTVGITPYAAVQTQWFHTPGYSETDLNGGGFALSYNAVTSNDTRSELGARADDLAMLGNMPMVLRARVAWAHDWVSNPALGAVFQALPGAAFTVNGAAIPANSALTSAGAQLFLTQNWSIEGKFEGEFASTAQTYAGTGTLKYSW
jgi:uncharacterized protein with beta-barrel porin domain